MGGGVATVYACWYMHSCDVDVHVFVYAVVHVFVYAYSCRDVLSIGAREGAVVSA